MIQVSIIGSGNVAQHLIIALQNAKTIGKEIELVQVFSRNKESLNHLLPLEKIVTEIANLKAVDLVIIAISDDAIASISSQLPFENKLVVHTSGSVAMEQLASKNRKGVFYPLQTFSKNKAIDFSLIPICLESENDADYKVLQFVAEKISNSIFAINSDQRKALHVAAVFVNNFANHLYSIGNEICAENKISFDILKPLIQETAAKILTLAPLEAQTGPAKRNDLKTIHSHLNFIKDTNQKEIYKILTQSIQNNVKKL